mgnify:FL=1|tara:strand:- start:563 stop:805 length:243 start_codon:yes stop_codon:yes gene_type:complete
MPERINMSAEYHKQRRIAEPELYRSRGREYSRRYRLKKKEEAVELKKLEDGIIGMDLDDLANLVIDNDDADPGEPPSGVI